MKRPEERRIADGLELRSPGEAEELPITLVGYPVVFNSLSVEMYGFREKVAPGAFTNTLKESKSIFALWGHDCNQVMGSTSNGSLTLAEDARGLAMVLTDPIVTDEQREMLTRGLITKMSFGFEAIRDQWEEDREAGTVTRTLLECRLYEVSPVAFPAYEDTSVSARAIQHAQELRNKILSTEVMTMPVCHIADHRRMSLALAERLAR